MKYNFLKELGVILLLLLFFSGCATHSNQTIIADYNHTMNFQYPEISIYYETPSSDTLFKCHLFAVSSERNKCHINKIETDLYRQSFKESKLFYDVHFANKDIEFALSIATAGQEKRSNNNNFNPQVIKADVNIYWQNIKLKSYQYSLPYPSSLHSKKEANKLFSSSLTSHVIADIQRDDVLSTQFLIQSLNSSDYQKNLTVPLTIGDFELAGQFLYNNPLLGSVSSYANPDFFSDKIDLYIYPIRKAQLNDSQALLNQESDIIKKDFLKAAAQFKWTNVEFSTIKSINIVTNKRVLKGITFEGEYVEGLGEKEFTSVYLFKIKDKFVKFRASFPASYITEHIKNIMDEITVPDESHFMRKLRKNELKNNKENAEKNS